MKESSGGSRDDISTGNSRERYQNQPGSGPHNCAEKPWRTTTGREGAGGFQFTFVRWTSVKLQALSADPADGSSDRFHTAGEGAQPARGAPRPAGGAPRRPRRERAVSAGITSADADDIRIKPYFCGRRVPTGAHPMIVGVSGCSLPSITTAASAASVQGICFSSLERHANLQRHANFATFVERLIKIVYSAQRSRHGTTRHPATAASRRSLSSAALPRVPRFP